MPSFRNIHGLVGIARSRLDWSWRLRWFLGVAAWGAGAILLAALVTRVVPRLALPAESPVWPWLTGAALLAAVAAGIAAPFRRPRGPLSDAILVDTRLSLRDRLGTALALEGATEPFALAAQDDGERTAGRSELRGKVAAAFAVKPPEHWWLAPSLAAAAVVAVLWMPQLDPWSRKKPEDPEEVLAARQAAESDVQAVVKKIEENDALAKALKEAVAPESKDAPKDGERSADEIRRDAARKVEQLAQKLDELLKGDEAAKLEALKNQLASLSLPQSKELQKFGEALKQGDFARAKEAMAELEKALAAGSLSEEQKEALAKALEKMAEQLKSSEAARKAAEDALAKAGLDPALAGNQQALQQAIQNSQNLTQAQKEALQKALAAQQAASQARQQMAQSLQQMASQCKGGSQGQQGSKPGSPGQGSQGGQSGQKPGQGQQPGSGMGGMLSDLEAAQLMMCQAEAARNAASQCKGGGMCQSPGNSLAGGNTRAQASGARAEAPSPTKTKLEQAKGTGAEADVIARQLVEGQSIVGEAQSKLQRLAGEIRPGFEEGTNEDPTPADRVEAQRHYFGQVKKLIEAKGAAPPAAAGGGAAPAKGGG